MGCLAQEPGAPGRARGGLSVSHAVCISGTGRHAWVIRVTGRDWAWREQQAKIIKSDRRQTSEQRSLGVKIQRKRIMQRFIN